jgi:dienelactone hydrolase
MSGCFTRPAVRADEILALDLEDLKAALGRLAGHQEVDAARIGAIGFCLGGSIVLTDDRLAAIAPFYGAAPKPREAIRRLCPVVGSWPGRDITTKAAGVLEAELTAAASSARTLSSRNGFIAAA